MCESVRGLLFISHQRQGGNKKSDKREWGLACSSLSKLLRPTTLEKCMHHFASVWTHQLLYNHTDLQFDFIFRNLLFCDQKIGFCLCFLHAWFLFSHPHISCSHVQTCCHPTFGTQWTNGFKQSRKVWNTNYNNNSWIIKHVSYCIRKEMDMWPYSCHNPTSVLRGRTLFLYDKTGNMWCFACLFGWYAAIDCTHSEKDKKTLTIYLVISGKGLPTTFLLVLTVLWRSVISISTLIACSVLGGTNVMIPTIWEPHQQ